MTEYIYLYIFHPLSEGDYPHSLFVGFIPVTRFGEAGQGKSRSASLLGQILLNTVYLAHLPNDRYTSSLWCPVQSVHTQQGQPEDQNPNADSEALSYVSVLPTAFHLHNRKTSHIQVKGCLENKTKPRAWKHQLKCPDHQFWWLFVLVRMSLRAGGLFCSFLFFSRSICLDSEEAEVGFIFWSSGSLASW